LIFGKNNIKFAGFVVIVHFILIFLILNSKLLYGSLSVSPSIIPLQDVLAENINGTAFQANKTELLQLKQTINPQTIQNLVSGNICSSKRPPVDIVFSIDSSPSMQDNDPTDLRLNASKSLIDKLNSTMDAAAAVSWGSKLGSKSELVSDFTKLKQEIGTINIDNASDPFTTSNTDYNIGIKEPIKILDTVSRNSSKIIIFLSDGQHNAIEPPPLPHEPNSALDYAKSKGYKIYTIGLNISSDSDGEKLLRVISEHTGGHYFSSPSAQNLAEIFNSIFVQEVQHFEFGNTNVHVSITGGGGTSERSVPIDVIFSVDSSSSMKKTDPDRLRIFSAKFFADKLNGSIDKAGVVSWTDELEFSDPLSSNLANMKEELDKVGNSGSTDVNLGIREAISLLDANDRPGPSSKAIIIITDGRSDVPVQVDLLAQEAKQKGYKIYTIGLTIKKGSPEEEELINLATQTSGQYYFPPTAANLQAAYNDIFQKVTESTAPLAQGLVEVLPDYITVDNRSFSITPTNMIKNNIGQTIIEWDNIAKYVGNKDEKLSSGEKFDVNFNVGFKSDIIKHISSTAGRSIHQNASQQQEQQNPSAGTSNQSGVGLSFKVPIIDDQRSVLRFVSPDRRNIEQHIPQTLVYLVLRTCNNQQILKLANTIQPTQEFLSYSNPLYHYEIKYPKSWQIKGLDNRVTFESLQDHPYDKYLESLRIDVLPANSVPTLNQVVKQLTDQDRTNIPNYTLLNSKSTSIAGMPAFLLTYTYTDSAWDLTKVMEYVTMSGDNVYIISYGAKPQYFDDKISIIEQMLNNFKINQ
jgi:Mg-chelatase subunit ChlD